LAKEGRGGRLGQEHFCGRRIRAHYMLSELNMRAGNASDYPLKIGVVGLLEGGIVFGSVWLTSKIGTAGLLEKGG